ncbi:MAG: DNA translocase FtsK [Thermodesulfovibrionales bacterium]
MAVARRIKAEITGVCSVLGALYLALSLVTYEKWDPSLFTFSTKPVDNMGGVVGAYVSDALMTFLGVSSFSLPVFLFVYGVKSLFSFEKQRVHLAGSLLLVFSGSVLAGLLAMSFGLEPAAGGLLGSGVSGFLIKGLSQVGAYMLALAMFLSSLILLSPVSLLNLVTRPGRPKAKKPAKAAEPKAEEKEWEAPKTWEEEEFPEPIVIEPSYTEAPAAVEEAPSPGARTTERAGEYVMPPLELLNLYEAAERPTRDEIEASSALLERKFADFSVQGRVVKVHTGPVVTMFEFEPAPGVKISRIVSLADDMALALRAQSVRVSTIPGKAAVGIEIPNTRRETVSLREILASEVYRKSASRLTIALGKDIYGAPIVADLSRMPHLLVAGATGAGKSVSLNSMVLSLLYKARPDEVKMLMIDPKLLELFAYNDIPHLISPVVTNPKEASEMLRRMVLEMEDRYRLIAEKGARNIESFNAVAAPEEKLPYIVIFVDELADLMIASASQVEDSIARLAQMARASGIHLVLATQRPSVDVITGLIKANFPARIAFQVTSKIDSRTIIDAQGAEQLIGKGDMLFMLPGVRIVRVHGALVTEGEVKAVTEHVRAQGSPDYDILEKLVKAEAQAEAADAEEAEDGLYQKALEYAEAMGEVSISSLQRKLKVGYNRAARIMELMEDDGLVGPPKGAGKPRDFLGRKGMR